jgi:hypothetical protein
MSPLSLSVDPSAIHFDTSFTFALPPQAKVAVDAGREDGPFRALAA